MQRVHNGRPAWVAQQDALALVSVCLKTLGQGACHRLQKVTLQRNINPLRDVTMCNSCDALRLEFGDPPWWAMNSVSLLKHVYV